MKAKSEFTITPGSEQVRYTIERDGYIDILNKWEEEYLPMPAAPALVSGQDPELIKRKKTPLYIHLTEISLNEMMEIPIHMHL
jgi:aconitate hydratase